jgi:hypothetical protein
MINSIGSQNYAVQQTRSNVGKVEQTTVNPPKVSENINSSDARKNAISFIETATPEELTAKLNSIKRSFPPAAMFNFNDIINSENSFEIAGRISRATKQFNQEAKVFHNKQLDLIKQGEVEGKTSKEILTNIMKLTDEQSELFKMSSNWGSKGLSAPENYAKLVELTPSYVNYYA